MVGRMTGFLRRARLDRSLSVSEPEPEEQEPNCVSNRDDGGSNSRHTGGSRKMKKLLVMKSVSVQTPTLYTN